MEEFPSNNESQEVSRGRSSEEVSVMEMEQQPLVGWLVLEANQ